MTDNDRLLSAEDLAAFLDVPIKTLYMWRYRGAGPIGFRIGRHTRYRCSDVEQWIGGRGRGAGVESHSARARARARAAGDRVRRLATTRVRRAQEERREGAWVLREARGWEGPSDHVPVIATLNDGS